MKFKVLSLVFSLILPALVSHAEIITETNIYILEPEPVEMSVRTTMKRVCRNLKKNCKKKGTWKCTTSDENKFTGTDKCVRKACWKAAKQCVNIGVTCELTCSDGHNYR